MDAIEAMPESAKAEGLSDEFGVSASKFSSVPNVGDNPIGVPVELSLEFGVPVIRVAAELTTPTNRQSAEAPNSLRN
jgi:hypothetical protein